MEKKHTETLIVGWEVITNEKGIEMAIVNRQQLVGTLEHIEKLKKTHYALLEALKEVVRI